MMIGAAAANNAARTRQDTGGRTLGACSTTVRSLPACTFFVPQYKRTAGQRVEPRRIQHSTMTSKTTTKTILITGASGYLGQHLIYSLLTDPPPITTTKTSKVVTEYRVLAACRSNAEALRRAVRKFRQKHADQEEQQKKKREGVAGAAVRVQVDQVDISDDDDPKAIEEYLASSSTGSIDCVVHAAAVSSPKACNDNPRLARSVNVPKHFFDALYSSSSRSSERESTAMAIVALSTDQVYEGTDPPYGETDSTDRAPNLYGKTKAEMEGYLLQKQSEAQQQQKQAPLLHILRSSIMVGPKAPFCDELYNNDDEVEKGDDKNDGAAPEPQLLKTRDTFLHFCASRQNERTDFYVDEKRSVVSISDVVQTIRYMILQQDDDEKQCGIGAGAVYNVGGPAAVSRYEMAQAVFRHLGYDDESILVPVEKSKMDPPPPIPTPLNTEMNVDKLRTLLQRANIELKTLDEMVKETFPK